MNVVKDSAYYKAHKLVITRHQKGADDFAAALKATNPKIESLRQPVLSIEHFPLNLAPEESSAALITTSKRADEVAQRAGLTAHYGLNSATGIDDVSALIGDIKARHHVDTPLLYLRGHDISFDLSHELRAAGFCVGEKIVYRALPVSALSDAFITALKNGDIAYITFFSARSAQIFEHLIVSADLGAYIAPIKALCLSTPVLNSLQDAPWQDRLICKDKTMASMTALVESLF
jgi:uroporphyrinogen-III synthase